MRNFLFGLIVGILIFPATAFLAGWLGLLPTNANAVPSEIGEDLCLPRARRSRISACTASRESDCAHARKSNGGIEALQGVIARAATVIPIPPQTSNPIFFIPLPSILRSKPDYQLFWIIKKGVRYSGMFAGEGQFGRDASGKDISDERIWTAVTFLTHLDSLPEVDAEWRKIRQE